MLTLSSIPFCSKGNCKISEISEIATLTSNISLLIVNLLFSSLLISRASSITFSRCKAEFRTMLRYLALLPVSGRCCVQIMILIIGMMEFKGVLSSCATDEKNMDFIFLAVFSIPLILVMSQHMAMIYLPLLILEALTQKYILGFLDLKTTSVLEEVCSKQGRSDFWLRSPFSRYFQRSYTVLSFGFSSLFSVKFDYL